jgi:hypothetical protein
MESTRSGAVVPTKYRFSMMATIVAMVFWLEQVHG